MNPIQIQSELKRSEGNGLPGQPYELYRDAKNYWTIGWGFCVDPRLGCRMPEHIAQLWLEYLIQETMDHVSTFVDWKDWWANIGDERQNVIACLVYNMGLTKIQAFHHMLSYLSEGDYDGAANELEASDWYDDVGHLRGDRMVRILRTGVWE